MRQHNCFFYCPPTLSQHAHPVCRVLALIWAWCSPLALQVGLVVNSTQAWVVMFTDGVECSTCRTAKTNLMRLAASLTGLPVRVGLVDCEQPFQKDFCYSTHALPTPPHRPVLKLWGAGKKHLQDKGEVNTRPCQQSVCDRLLPLPPSSSHLFLGVTASTYWRALILAAH